MKPNLRRNLFPIFLALVAVSASLAQSLSRGFPPPADLTTQVRPLPAYTPGPTEAELQSAMAGKTLIRMDARGFQRVVATHGTHGRLITGPALLALAQGEPSRARPTPETRPGPARLCHQADSLGRRACLDSLSRARVADRRNGDSDRRNGDSDRRNGDSDRRNGDSDRRNGDSDRRNGDSDRRNGDSAARRDSAASPRALREIEESRDTVYIGPDGEEIGRPSTTDAAASADEVQEERTRGYIGQLFVDMGNSGGGDWDWGGGDWAVVIYVVVGVIVVGAFVLGGGKAIYDLVVNREEAPVFKELGARFSYSGLSMYGNDGTALYRDAYLYGLRFAIGVERSIMSLGLAAEGGSINLSVRGFPGERNSLDVRGAYLVGGPMVRFGNYHPLAFSLEFLNGTSNHRSIGWISKSRMTLAGKTRRNLLLGAHLGAVFYDLEFTDGLVFRSGDLNRDLSMLLGLDLGYAF